MTETAKGHLVANHQYEISLNDVDAKSNIFVTIELLYS